MRIFRNVFRRKMRAFLTIFGITIGVLALVVMGSVAEKLQLLVDGGVEYYADKVIVTDGATFAGFGMSPISASLVEDAEEIEGIERASAIINFLLADDVTTISMGTPPMVEATDFRNVGYQNFETPIAEGRDLEEGDEGKVAVGADLVNQLEAEVGGTVEIRGEEFEVAGIYARTLSAPDSTVVMTLEDGQRIFLETLPETIREQIDQDDLATSIVLFPEEGLDPDEMVDVVSEELGEDFNVQGPAGFEKFVKEPLAIFNYLIYTVALIALVVGTLSIINTMTMSISERTREIGVRKAIGATRGPSCVSSSRRPPSSDSAAACSASRSGPSSSRARTHRRSWVRRSSSCSPPGSRSGRFCSRSYSGFSPACTPRGTQPGSVPSRHSATNRSDPWHQHSPSRTSPAATASAPRTTSTPCGE
jgi:putative ABC transport system permease protein